MHNILFATITNDLRPELYILFTLVSFVASLLVSCAQLEAGFYNSGIKDALRKDYHGFISRDGDLVNLLLECPFEEFFQMFLSDIVGDRV